MNKLALSVDTRNRGMPVAHTASYNNFYQSGVDGAAIPSGARFMEVTILGDSVSWVAFGGENVAVTVPTENVTNGRAPLGIIEGLLFELPTTGTHFSLACEDPVVVGFYS